MIIIYICDIRGDSNFHLQKLKANALAYQNFEYFLIIQFLVGLITYRVTEGRSFSFGMGFLSAFEVKSNEIK